jgi:electron transfer flavoprotein alpha subunit
MSTILVVAEHHGGRINRASFEAIAAAQQLGDAVTVVLPGQDVARVASDLAVAEVREVVTLEHALLQNYTADGYVAALHAWISAGAFESVVFAHTYQARDFAPRLAARFGRSVIADCIAVKTDGGAVTLTRPVFQGKLSADVTLEGPAPHFISFQVGAMPADTVRRGASPAAVRRADADVRADDVRLTPEAPFREARQAVDLTRAERIVAVGRGIKEERHVALAQQLAAALGAEIAASRPICDANWLPMDRQVGSSGQTVTPRLYLALGISGAIQHIVGMKGARTIVAVNKDPDAPIFEIADYGIVGDLFEIVPAIIEALHPRPA